MDGWLHRLTVIAVLLTFYWVCRLSLESSCFIYREGLGHYLWKWGRSGVCITDKSFAVEYYACFFVYECESFDPYSM